jgi:two-component system, LytTR family, sensor histidine kinase AlgZ
MAATTHDDDRLDAPAARAALWTDSTRPAELRSTGFGPTVFDTLASAEPRRPAASTVFDVCHVGVVLRALLFVHVAIGVGAVFVAARPAAWLAIVAAGSSAALPGVLIWLLAACALKMPLGHLALPGRWAAALALGAAAGGIGAALAWIAGLDLWGIEIPGVAHWLGHALAGALFAGVTFQWLHMRAQALLPADTTARLAELQQRIRPHFLFNTLNTALALVRVDPERAERVLEDLAELFRVALTESGDSVSLGEEVELAQRYLAIEQIRFGSRLQVSWELDPAAASARVPPLLLQPLVENAVRHGVEPADEGGVLRIRTRVRMGRAVVSIVNSVPEAPSRPGNGIALRNVRERLRLMHDVSGQFESRLDGRTFRVQIMVPL